MISIAVAWGSGEGVEYRPPLPPPLRKCLLLKNYCLLIEKYLSKMNFKQIDGLHQSY